MSAKIYVPLDEAWDFFEDNIEDLKKQYVELACDDTVDDYKSVVYMTENDGRPELLVEVAGVEVERSKAYSSHHLRYILEQYYTDYVLFLSSEDKSVEETLKETEEDIGADEVQYPEPSEIDDVIIRDDELLCALDDFLHVAINDMTYENLFSVYGYDMLRTILQSVVDMLYDKYGVYVYWPQIEADDDGNEIIVTNDYELTPVDRLLDNGGGQDDA